MNVQLIAESATTVTFGWQTVPGARGFRYTRPDGVKSHTWDGATVSAKFKKMDGVYLIEPLMISEIGQGVYPPAPPPPSAKVVTSITELNTALSVLKEGDNLLVSGVTFSGQFTIRDKAVLGVGADITFDSACRFLGNGPRLLNCVWVKNCSGIRFHGGRMTNPTGHGILMHDSDVSWDGFVVDGVAGTCVMVLALTRACVVHIDGEVARNGGDITMDPHQEKGTGLHGVYWNGGAFPLSGSCKVYAHDLPAGAAVQFGPNTQDTAFDVRAERCTKVATIQVGGNALQAWGDNIKGVTAVVDATDMAGRVVETDGLYDGKNPPGAITVTRGRSSGTIRLSPRYAPVADGSVIYQDCT